jgi:hypothetical protein
MHWKGCGWKWPRLNLNYCPGICLERNEEYSGKTQKRQSMCPDLTLGPLEHNTGTLTAQV